MTVRECLKGNGNMNIDNVQFNVELSDILNDLLNALGKTELFSKGFKDSGDNIMVQCPYHSNGQEKRPSAGIHKETGVFHCFACGEIHSLAEFISYCFGYNDGGLFGWKWLLKNYVSVSVEERKDVVLDFVRNSTDRIFNSDISVGKNERNSRWTERDSKKFGNYVSEEELDKYRYIHPYMYKRGLTDEIIELFDIGYDERGRCITFPVRDIQGNCLFVARRSVDYKYFHYPKGVEKPLYGLYELYHGKLNADYIGVGQYQYTFPSEVIVCESMLDALSFWTVGKYAVALNGLGNELQFKQLRDLPCRKLILATDMDERGLSARDRIKKNIKNKLISEYFFPEGRKDANECTKEELHNLHDSF